MSVKLDFLNSIKSEILDFAYENAIKDMKKLPPIHQDIITPIDPSKIVGGVYKSISAIAAGTMARRANGQPFDEDRPLEGYEIIGSLKHVSKKVKCASELERDWQHRAKSWIKEYVAKNWSPIIANTKTMLLTDFLEKGGYTAGDDIYNNDDSESGLVTYASPKLQYDGKPIFNYSDNLRAAYSQSAALYNAMAYNDAEVGVDVGDVSYALADAMKNRLIINGKMENGEAFDNISNVQVICAPQLADKWARVNDSEKDPDTMTNASNPFYKKIKRIIPLHRISGSSPTLSIMQSNQSGIEAYFSDFDITFWEKNDPQVLYAGINMDYMIVLKNFRYLVSVNSAKS